MLCFKSDIGFSVCERIGNLELAVKKNMPGTTLLKSRSLCSFGVWNGGVGVDGETVNELYQFGSTQKEKV
jgi:hypothetical protein